MRAYMDGILTCPARLMASNSSFSAGFYDDRMTRWKEGMVRVDGIGHSKMWPVDGQ